jgi:hypothetical protein
MADGGLLLVFRGMDTGTLLTMQAKLQGHLSNLSAYSSQTVGSKSFTRDVNAIQRQLEAIQFVLNERGSGIPQGYEGIYLTDFSTGIPQGQPAGTTDQLTY